MELKASIFSHNISRVRGITQGKQKVIMKVQIGYMKLLNQILLLEKNKLIYEQVNKLIIQFFIIAKNSMNIQVFPRAQNFNQGKLTSTQPQRYSLDNNKGICQVQQNKLSIIQPKTKKNIKICRICLQVQQGFDEKTHQSEKNYADKKSYNQTIIQLPCSCKGQLGMIHDNCIKFWIKIWLESKMKDHRTDGQARIRRLRPVTEVEAHQPHLQPQSQQGVDLNQPSSNSNQNRHLIKPLDFQKIKQNTIYPFVCEVCHSQFYFDLIFHRRLKAYFQLRKKQIGLFIVSLLFAMIFMGICINWYFQSGINIYLIVFFLLCWMPMTCITIAAATWTFTKRQVWIKQIYSRKDLQRIAQKKNENLLQEKKKQRKIREITKQKLMQVNFIKNIFKQQQKQKENNKKKPSSYWSKLNFLSKNTQKQNNKNDIHQKRENIMKTTQNLKKMELSNNFQQQDIVIQIQLQPQQNLSPKIQHNNNIAFKSLGPQSL